jgi:hypothetical protein
MHIYLVSVICGKIPHTAMRHVTPGADIECMEESTKNSKDYENET